jgi:hypothetical protein
MQAAGLAGSNREDERASAMNDVYTGCMAQQGYARAPVN